MAARKARPTSRRRGQSPIYSARVQLVMYSLLLVATPFILLQNFLQQAIGEMSAARMHLGSAAVPIVPCGAVLALVVLGITFRRQLTGLRVVAGIAALVLVALAQQIADYYFDHSFYDLQQNWHYIAYTLFALMVYRDLGPRGTSLPRIMQATLLLALLFSTFDEIVQMHISNRVFDIGDIAKDTWGAATGVVLLVLGRSERAELRRDWSRIRQCRLSLYFRQPASTLVLILLFAIIFLAVSSLLTEIPYWTAAAGITIGVFLVFFLLLHVSASKWGGRVVVVLAAGVLIGLGGSFVVHRSEDIVHERCGLVVYKGIPIPFFDVMIFPDGTFRLVDKKHYFNDRDRAFLLRKESDIILIGSGRDGKGGRGFPEPSPSQFLFNPHTGRGTQVIILENPEACRVFNRLKRESKSVLFVLHDTC
jgi:VanZ family protein